MNQENQLQVTGGFQSLPATRAGHVATQSREVAEIQTRFLMAQQFPRDERKAMDSIINAFSRPGLAERAQYEYSKGGSEIAGPSIHAAQALAQGWGNVAFGWRELSRGTDADGVNFSEVQAYAIDLQSRVPADISFIVRHWRDRKNGGGYALKDEREIYELAANMAARRKRACILSVLPQDVIDAAMAQAEVTLKTKADTSPEAMAKLLEAFAAFKVDKGQIEKLIQRRLDAITPAQVMRLRRIYTSLRDGMSEPAEWFEAAEPAAPPSSSAEAVKTAMGKSKGPKAPEPPPPPAEAPAAPSGPAHDLAYFAAHLKACPDPEVAGLILDESREYLSDEDSATLAAQYSQQFNKSTGA